MNLVVSSTGEIRKGALIKDPNSAHKVKCRLVHEIFKGLELNQVINATTK